jgi:guanyl-specific ribonuclease Sa
VERFGVRDRVVHHSTLTLPRGARRIVTGGCEVIEGEGVQRVRRRGD